MEGMKNNYLGGMVQRAMEDERSSHHTWQVETPTQEKFRTGGVGEDGHSRTRTFHDEVGSAVTAGQGYGQTQRQAPGQAQSRASGHTTGQTRSQASGHTADPQTKASPGKGKGGFLKGLISGTVISDSIILKDVRYTAMIVLLAIIFIANRFNAERVEREISALEQEVRDLRAESLSVSADLGSVSRQSEISDLVKERGLGLEELREPPYRIVVNE